MGRIKTEIINLKETDTYSLILFALFKMRNIPEYAPLSELVYLLDKEILLKLCEFFGGTTLQIPTINELELITYSLVLYQYVDIEGMSYDEAVKLIGHHTSDLRTVKKGYKQLKQVLDQYDFKRGVL